MQPLSPIQSFTQLRRILHWLGWEGLQMERAPVEKQSESAHPLMEYFFTIGEMDSQLYLQVNPLPLQHSRLYGICVYAMGYRLCSGWHGIIPTCTDDAMRIQLDHVRSWIARDNFTSLNARREYRFKHPECKDWSWLRIQNNGGPPYCQQTCMERLPPVEL